MRDPLNQELDDLRAENKALRKERDEWHARAFALFWSVPDTMTIGEIQDRTAKAKAFLGPDGQSTPPK